MEKLSLKDLNLSGKKVIMRVDFNVPLNDDGTISDDTRIKAALPSIKYILDKGSSLILMSHLGKPKGKDLKYSLKPCAKRLSELLLKEVLFVNDCIGDEVEKKATSLKGVMLLENLRFYEAEEKPDKDPSFAEKLSKLADIYVNDAFGTAHRAHSSTATITRFFKGRAALGFLMEKEVNFLGKALNDPKRPFYAIIGGAKISSKIGVVLKLLEKVDLLFIGGGMSYTFMKAMGKDIGSSLVEMDQIENVKKILYNKKLVLPKDVVIADVFKNEANIKIVNFENSIPTNWQGMDIGPKTISDWSLKLKEGSTLFWNGPLGVFEFPNFAKGTNAIAKVLAEAKGVTIVGGGDSVAAINQMGLADKFDHLSTGGGASLEYIEYGQLPGIEALSDKIVK